MKEKLKDFGFGVATVVLIIGLVSALFVLGELVGATSDTIRIALATPFFIYFCYIFGGVTRTIYVSKD